MHNAAYERTNPHALSTILDEKSAYFVPMSSDYFIYDMRILMRIAVNISFLCVSNAENIAIINRSYNTTKSRLDYILLSSDPLSNSIIIFYNSRLPFLYDGK